MKTDNIFSLLGKVAIALSIVAVAGMAYINAQQYLLNQAVDACMRVSVVESQRAGEGDVQERRVTEPVRDIYAYCLQDKGVAGTSVFSKVQ